MTDYIMQRSGGASTKDVTIEELYRYFMNPYDNIKKIREISQYLTSKHGILRDVNRMMYSLPNLKYKIIWSDNDDIKRNKRNEKKVRDFLNELDVVKLVRDGLKEVPELGTVVTCLRANKYVQFLDLDEIVINKQRNGKWVVEYDLASLDNLSALEQQSKMYSLPDEVTPARYLSYKNKRDDSIRYVELSNCDVIAIDNKRNYPFGLPMSMGAWQPLLQKEIINRVERSVSDRLIKNILILSASFLDGEQKTPVPKEIISGYFKEVSNLINKKDGGTKRSNDSSGTATIALPHFLKLDTLEVDTTMFKKELYEKIENDIYANLGVSPALIYGGGGNYASANANSEKFFSFIITILEQFESIINRYLNNVLKLPKGLSCEIKFDRSTILDKNSETEKLKELYLQTGIAMPYLESVMGVDYQSMIAQAKYEKEILKTENYLFPPQNAYTSSSKDNSSNDDPTNDNTLKTKSDDGNNTPSPSD